jgi:hypothetical protein
MLFVAMNIEPSLKELLTRAKLVDEAPRLIRQIQLKLDRVIKQHQREISLIHLKANLEPAKPEKRLTRPHR